MGAALVIREDNIEEINLPADTGESLKAKYRAIGCTAVDVVRLSTTVDMWIDDESLYNFPPNPLATALARHFGFTRQPYHGPVVLCGVDDEGNSVDLDTHQIRALLTRLADIVG